MARHLGRGVRNGCSGMPRVAFAPSSVRDLEHLRALPQPKSVPAPCGSSESIRGSAIGRPVEEMPECRVLLVDFGDSGYVALYRHTSDQVTVLAPRHQREAAGYRT